MRFACRGARSRGDRRSEIEVDPDLIAPGHHIEFCVEAKPQLRASDQPPVTPGELSPARSRSRLGRGIVHVTGGLNRGRVGVLRAPPAYDFRSAPASPDGVCACLFRSFL